MDQYYYEYKDDGDIKYCYPGTQVLVNKFDIHNGQQLSKVEREISIVKAAVLADRIQAIFILIFLWQMKGKCWKLVWLHSCAIMKKWRR